MKINDAQPMDAPTSQADIDDTPAEQKKERTTEGINVIMDQAKCVQKVMNYEIRTFRYEDVQIETVSGALLTTRMWVSDKDPVGMTAKEQKSYKCKVCAKEFDKNQKLLLHERFHNIQK